MHTVLFELGTEELPASELGIKDAFLALMQDALSTHRIDFTQIQVFFAPRRLAVLIHGIASKQTSVSELKRGPSVVAAYDQNGNLTKAALGFMQGLGISQEDLTTTTQGKGEYIAYMQTLPAQSTVSLLPQIIQKALDALPLSKKMRWGAQHYEFIRPVHWTVLMVDDQVIDAAFLGARTANITFGHRMHSPHAITINHAQDYEKVLHQHYVIADFDKRRAKICQDLHDLGVSLHAQVIMPDALIDEVCAITDYPCAHLASFDARFLALPQEALILTMQQDQRYFCLTQNHKLLPNFIFVANIDSKDSAQVIAGNEKVIRPRLSDVEFFFAQDKSLGLDAMHNVLSERVFADKLGNLAQKSVRVANLCTYIGRNLALDSSLCVQASKFAKADLMSALVGEMPELQGVAGGYYAHAMGLDVQVADAISEQYLPRFASDNLPATALGICLALADRVDSFVGIFAIHGAPTGSKDPFALRRLGIAILRLMARTTLSLDDVLHKAQLSYANDGIAIGDDKMGAMYKFLVGRYRALYEHHDTDVVLAALAKNEHLPFDIDARVVALQDFKHNSEKLAQNQKRMNNILKGVDIGTINPAHFTHSAEHDLYNALQSMHLVDAKNADDWTKNLAQFAVIDAPLSGFFDAVMVNDDNPIVRENRLALIGAISQKLHQVGDLGLLAP